ncbi:MAG TPA: efflux RND transporter periplasmic adaptor subunit [Acidobacteriaceae bacterium]|jgi:RND family efflux transporter MFP subunit|nr:efflux RND transporter periplasmic adaptor subunit [Acidobacteriaceae bacterium]
MTEAHSSQHQQGGPHLSEPPPLSGRKALVALGVFILLAAVLAIALIVPRLRAQKTLTQRTNELAIADVTVAKPQLGSPSQEIVLPGNLFAYVDSPIYARTDGYLEKWYFDIGARVKKGQLLATIASPEVDQQLEQAKADLATAVANSTYAKQQAQRYTDLLASNAVAKQDTENFVTQAASTNTQVKAAQANVDRLMQLTGFEKVYAPFDGVVTARDVDTGTLINAGAGTSGGREMFHMDDEHIMRVYVNVPQVDAPSTTPGTPADLTLNEYPGRRFEGKVVRTSRSIDPASRTLLVEVDVPNRDGSLEPGAYAQVHFRVNVAHQTLIVPVSTLMFREEGLRVVTVGKDKDGKDIARLVPITIGQDDGRVVQVIAGLGPSDLVVQNPPDSIIDGEIVRVVNPQQDGVPGSSGLPEENHNPQGSAGPEGGSE